jgi:hypothetical protein
MYDVLFRDISSCTSAEEFESNFAFIAFTFSQPKMDWHESTRGLSP